MPIEDDLTPMQFRFDPNQEYQTDAIESMADLFDGMARAELDLNFTLGFAAVPNRLDLDEARCWPTSVPSKNATGRPKMHSLASRRRTPTGEERQIASPTSRSRWRPAPAKHTSTSAQRSNSTSATA